MSQTKRTIIWGLAIAVLLAILHALKDILFPFVAGMAFAYFLDPLADKLEEKGCSRLLATTIIILALFLLILFGLALLFPVLQSQIVSVAERLPVIIAVLQSNVADARSFVESALPPDTLAAAGHAASDYSATIIGWAKTVVSKLVSGGSAFFELISLVLVAPIVSFYMLLEWDNIVSRMDHLLPRGQAPVIRQQIRLMDESISAFVRGQTSVCLCLAAYYAVALSLTGLEAGLLIGLGAGLISFVPYVGAITGIAVGVGVGIVQFDTWGPVFGIASIFIIGQVCESYILTPRLVGDKVGLHSLWIVFALMVGGSLFGFTGILLAVPTAASIGVLIRYGTGCYLDSTFYRGNGDSSA